MHALPAMKYFIISSIASRLLDILCGGLLHVSQVDASLVTMYLKTIVMCRCGIVGLNPHVFPWHSPMRRMSKRIER